MHLKLSSAKMAAILSWGRWVDVMKGLLLQMSYQLFFPGQNRYHFADGIFRCIFLNENVWIFIKISLNFVPKGSMNNIPAMVQIMAWRRIGDKPFFLKQCLPDSLMHICGFRGRWAKTPSADTKFGMFFSGISSYNEPVKHVRELHWL